MKDGWHSSATLLAQGQRVDLPAVAPGKTLDANDTEANKGKENEESNVGEQRSGSFEGPKDRLIMRTPSRPISGSRYFRHKRSCHRTYRRSTANDEESADTKHTQGAEDKEVEVACDLDSSSSETERDPKTDDSKHVNAMPRMTEVRPAKSVELALLVY